MPKNKKTKEELQAEIDAAIVDPPQDPSENVPSPSIPPPPDDIVLSPSEPDDDSVPSPSIPPPPDDTVPSPSEPIPSKEVFKSKARAEGKENIVLHAQTKKIAQAIDEANKLPEPTIDELKVKYPEWDDMTQTEQRLAKDAFITDRRFKMIEEATKEGRQLEQWMAKVDEFIDDPKTLVQYPLLEGKTDAFKEFLMQPTRRGANFPDMVAAFLFDATKIKKPNRGKMMETGSAGPNGQDTHTHDDGKIGLEEAATLMRTNYRKYRELLKAGRIDFSRV